MAKLNITERVTKSTRLEPDRAPQRDERWRPAVHEDREAMPDLATLVTHEELAKFQFSPRKLRWKEVADLDQRIDELSAAQTKTLTELNEAQSALARGRPDRRERIRRVARRRLGRHAPAAHQAGPSGARR